MLSLTSDVMSVCRMVCVTLSLMTCLHTLGACKKIKMSLLIDIEVDGSSGYGRYIGGAFYLALQDLKPRLDAQNVTIEHEAVDTHGDRVRALEQQVDRRNGTTVFIGPNGNCHVGMVTATAMNVPYFTYSCYDGIVSDSARMLFVNTEPLLINVVKFVSALLQHFRWTSYILICGDDTKWRETCKRLVNVTTSNHISLNAEFYDSRTSHYYPALDHYTSIVKKTSDKTRVYVFMGNGYSLADFLRTMHEEGLTNKGDHAVVGVVDISIDEIRKNALLNLTQERFKAIFRNLLWLTPRPVDNPEWETFLDYVHERNKEKPICFPIPPIPSIMSLRVRTPCRN